MNLTLTNCIGNVSLYKNGTLINHVERAVATTSAINNFTTLGGDYHLNLTVSGLYNITAYYFANANYTDASNTLWINVASANGTAVNRTDQNITINQIITSVLIPDNSSFKNITIPIAISENQSIDLDVAAITGLSGNATLLENMTFERDGATNNYTVTLMGNTSVYGGSAWDGRLYLPIVNYTQSWMTPTGTPVTAISIGSSTELNFSQPAKILISGMAGKHVAWGRDGSLAMNDIPTVCDSATNPTNINASNAIRECYKDSGTDLVIWTYHFTTFALYTPTPAAEAAAASSSSGGGCLTNWTCTAWSACANGQQTRTCSLIKSYCYGGIKPDEMQYCNMPPAAPAAITAPTPAPVATPPVTGAVVQPTAPLALGAGIAIIAGLAAIAIIAYFIFLRKK
jgi:hypothetical protein